MSRSFLRWFYLAVQFVMLAVSIPKVAMLFHAYDAQTLGPLIGGVDLRSWLVGIAIDLTATFTTWAAMAKYDETRTRRSLAAPGLIVLLCTALSVIANYEDAATITPQQYSSINLFSQSALYVNPILISAPPVLVLLLILLVPSVMSKVRIRNPEEIAAEASEREAQILADARIREAKARANAQVRQIQLGGLADTVGAAVRRARSQLPAAPDMSSPVMQVLHPVEPLEIPVVRAPEPLNVFTDTMPVPKIHIVQPSRALTAAERTVDEQPAATPARPRGRGRKPAVDRADGGVATRPKRQAQKRPNRPDAENTTTGDSGVRDTVA